MDTQLLIAKTREIMQSRYASMESQHMGDADPEVTREDLYGQLKAILPDLSSEDMTVLYNTLEEQGHIKLITNDVVSFEKGFVE